MNQSLITGGGGGYEYEMEGGGGKSISSPT